MLSRVRALKIELLLSRSATIVMIMLECFVIALPSL